MSGRASCPIGTLLLWRRRPAGERVELGGVAFPSSSTRDSLAVVDGQQRLASLTLLLIRGQTAGQRTVVYDLDHARFRILRRGDVVGAREIPTDKLGHPSRLMGWIFEHGEGLSEQERDSVFLLATRILNYTVPSYVIETNDEGVVREVFRRLNRTGRALSDAQAFDAIHGLFEEGHGGHVEGRSLRAIDVALQASSFGTIGVDTLAKVLKAIAGQDVARSLDLVSKSRGAPNPDEVRDLHERILASMDRVITFLIRDAGIAHVALMPYKLPLVTLAVFFDIHPAPSARSRALLSRWLWRGALSREHQGATAATRRALAPAREHDETRAVAGLLRTVQADVPFGADVRERFNFRNAQSKVIASALAATRPASLATAPDVGGSVMTPTLFAADERHQTRWPQLVPRRRGEVVAPAEAALRASAANILLHPWLGPKELLAALRRADESDLASHLLDREVVAALVRRDGAAALARRATLLQDHVDRFVGRQAAWRPADRDRPALASMDVDDAAA